MDEYIGREEVFNEIRFQREYAESNGEASVVDTCDAMLHNLGKIETADVQPVKHGRWIYGENDDGQDGIFCSECEHFIPWFYEYYDKSDDLINDNPRCPNCGSYNGMDGE